MAARGGGPNADRDSRTQGYTALMWAARQGHDGIVAQLLRADADITTTARDGSTALSLARKFGREKCVELLQKARDARKGKGGSEKVLQEAIETAIAQSARKQEGKTAAHAAVADETVPSHPPQPTERAGTAARGGCPTKGCGQYVGATEAAREGLKKCGRCGQVAYCSRTCQKAAWKDGHKQECEALQEEREKALQEERRQRLYREFAALYTDSKFRDMVDMSEEVLAVAGEVQSAQPEVAGLLYSFLGTALTGCREFVKGMGVLEQGKALAMALAEETGNRSLLSSVLQQIGVCHWRLGEHSKSHAACEEALAISKEQGDRVGEKVAAYSLGVGLMSAGQHDKALEIFEQQLALCEELGDRSGVAETQLRLGQCLLRQGQFDDSFVYLKQSWAFSKQEDDRCGMTKAAMYVGEALWLQARAERHQAAPDASSSGAVWVAGPDTLHDAEKWLRTAMDLAVEFHEGCYNWRMDVQMHLACVAMMKGDENEAVELLLQYLQGWLDDLGTNKTCAGCLQVRGEEAPMMACAGCRFAWYCNEAHQRMGWKGEASWFSFGVPHKAICPLLKQWRRHVAKGKATAESGELREEMVAFLWRMISSTS